MTDRRLGADVAAVVLLTVGLLVGDPWLLSLAVIPLSVVVLDAVTPVPDPQLHVERRVDPVAPAPGSTATVSLVVRNDGEASLPDIRVVDGVPETVPVVEGRPRGCASLRAGDELTIEYTVRARPELHEFDDPTVTVRNLGGCSSRTISPQSSGDDALAPSVPFEHTPERADSATIGGRHPVAEAGEGVEFYRTREYRTGDPRSRVDWRRFAKTGELATIEYRERGGAAIVVVVDARTDGDLAPAPTAPTGRSLSLYAGAQLVGAAGQHGTDLGVAAFDASGRLNWLPVGGDAEAATGLLRTITDDQQPPDATTALDFTTASPIEPADWIERQLPSVATVVLVSPLYDDAPLAFVRRLHDHGRSVAVVAPSAAVGTTPGATTGLLHRQTRIERLRTAGIDVIDWSPDEPVPTVLQSLGVTEA